MSDRNTLETLLTGFAEVLRPISDAAARPPVPSGLLALMRDAGLDLDLVLVDPAPAVEALEATAAVYSAVLPLLDEGGFDDPRRLKKLGEALVRVVKAVRALDALQLRPELENAPASVARQLLDYLIVDYLERRHPTAFTTLVLAGAISEADVVRRLPARTHPEVVALWIREPEAAFREVYGWGGDAFQAQLFLQRLAELLVQLQIPAYFQNADPEVVERVSGEAEAAKPQRQLRVPVFARVSPDAEDGFVQLGLSVLPLAAAADEPAGLAVLPFVTGAAGMDEELGNQWRLALQLSGDLTLQYGLVVRPGGAAVRSLSAAEQPPSEVAARLTVERRTPADARIPLLSGPGGVQAELGTIGMQLGLSYRDAEAEFEVRLPIRNALLSVRPPAEDGFLNRILPADGLNAGFDLAVGWSSRRGLFFEGGAGLEAVLPVAATLGGLLDVDVLHVGLRADEGGVRGAASASATVQLGPVTAVVEQVGVEAALGFPADGGNLGVADLSIGFKPPAGAGLKVNAGAVKGGGYLFFDAERGQYAGIMDLQLGGTIAVKAVGLITTRMPDGSPGFSLFVLITAEKFAPVQLGMGFTLNGVGGMLGVNRTVMTEVLRQGLRNNVLDSVLFPPDPLGNAPTVISNLNRVFPAARDRFLFGPMAVLGWGTPTLVTLKVALLLEIPDPVRLLMLGRLSVVLPEPAHPLVSIQLDALGELDFQKGTVSLDGVLFDSRLLEFTLTGAMALRASWGDRPYFLLSLGGFNPRFPVPAGLPRLERLALSLASSENLRLRFEGYLALTSNTAQFGARVELFARAGAVSVDGYLGFDTLIQFAPFGFIADVAAGVALRYNSKLLAGIQLALTISGPTPWHVRGTARLEILFLSVSVDIDYRFGPAAPPPLPEPVDVGVLLRAALSDPRSWSSELPAEARTLVALREVEGAGLVAHPLARLTVRQRVVPLNTTISRFGNARPSGERHFQVEATVDSDAATLETTYLQEQFAIGQFQDLREDEKLRHPSFQPLDAGFRFGTDAFDFDEALGLEATIGYELIAVDTPAAGPQRVERALRAMDLSHVGIPDGRTAALDPSLM